MSKQQTTPVTVVGALNLDLCGAPSDRLLPRDSTPGRVTLSPGGVGHNIARHIAAAGAPVELLTAMAGDAASALLAHSCTDERIGLSHAIRLPGASPAYLCIHDESGDMALAINDMALIESLTQDHLSHWMPTIDTAPLCVCDANLPAHLLRQLAFSAKTPLLLDPVSGVKAMRVRPFIGRFTAVKPNALESAALSGETDPARAARWFLAEGVRHVFVSLGAEGVYWADAKRHGTMPAEKPRVSGYTGAGDAMAAGIALGLLRGETTEGCARLGMATVKAHLLIQNAL